MQDCQLKIVQFWENEKIRILAISLDLCQSEGVSKLDNR